MKVVLGTRGDRQRPVRASLLTESDWHWRSAGAAEIQGLPDV